MAELKERYARALFELSVQDKPPEELVEQASFVRDVLETDQCMEFLQHPHIPDTAKRRLVESLFADKVAGELMGFLYLCIGKSREALIIPALSACIDMGQRYSGKVVATVVSAVPLRETQLSALHSLLSKKRNKQVELVQRVDPALIGGFYIHMDGRLIDRTVRTQLKNLRESMIRGQAG